MTPAERAPLEPAPRAADLRSDLASLQIEHGAPAPRRRWPLLVGVALLLVIAAAVLLRGGLFDRPLEVDTVRPAPADAAEGGPAPILNASGYVVPRRKAVVSAKIQGRLSRLRVEEGTRVREGEIIAELENADSLAQVRRAGAAVQRAEADLAESRRQARVAEILAREAVGSEDAREAALSRVRIGEAALAQAQAELALEEAEHQNTLIRAPFTGVVVKKMAEVGESVAPIPPGVNISTSSGAIAALADLDTLEVEADISESQVARLGDAQPAEVSVEAFPDRRYRAVLRQVIPTADRTKATVQVKVTILDRDRDLKPEMTAKVTFLEASGVAAAGGSGRTSAAAGASAAPVFVVPQEAVVTRDGRPVVFAIEEGRARQRPVVIAGPPRRGQVYVREGIGGDEVLVAQPPEDLADGTRVRAFD